MADREVSVKLTVDASEYRDAIRRLRKEALAAGITAGWEFDLALALGYEAGSWDGMYKLTPHPFTIGPDYVLAEEVVYVEGSDRVALLDGDNIVTRHVRHALPDGWRTEPAYRVVPPSNDEA